MDDKKDKLILEILNSFYPSRNHEEMGFYNMISHSVHFQDKTDPIEIMSQYKHILENFYSKESGLIKNDKIWDVVEHLSQIDMSTLDIFAILIKDTSLDECRVFFRTTIEKKLDGETLSETWQESGLFSDEFIEKLKASEAEGSLMPFLGSIKSILDETGNSGIFEK